MTQQEKAKKFLALHQAGRPLILPNAWDALSAMIFEREGFEAIATTSGGIANMLGYADGQHLPPRLMLEIVGRIAASVGVPVTADLEAGYGKSDAEIAVFVGEAMERGIVGLNFEDSTRNPAQPLMEIGAQAERIRAIRKMAESKGVSLVINARVDVYLQAGDAAWKLEEGVRRAKAYREAGADCLFPIIIDTGAIGQFVKEAGGPVNILSTPATPGLAELAALGVARVSFGTSISRAMLPLQQAIAKELRKGHLHPALHQRDFPGPVVNGFFGA